MGFPKRNQNNNPLLILKVVSRKDSKPCEPYFSVLSKNQETDKWEEQSREGSVEGIITKIDKKVGEFNGEPYTNTLIYLKDETNNFLLELKSNMLSRSLLNSILGIENFSKVVRIDLYNNKKGFASGSVYSGGEKVSWKYSLEEQPSADKVKFKGREMTDFSKIDAFFEEKVAELGKELAGESTNAAQVEDEVVEPPQPVKEVKNPKSKAPAPKDPDLDPEEDSDLPF